MLNIALLYFPSDFCERQRWERYREGCLARMRQEQHREVEEQDESQTLLHSNRYLMIKNIQK